jgi:hypothetical protein
MSNFGFSKVGPNTDGDSQPRQSQHIISGRIGPPILWAWRVHAPGCVRRLSNCGGLTDRHGNVHKADRSECGVPIRPGRRLRARPTGRQGATRRPGAAWDRPSAFAV